MRQSQVKATGVLAASVLVVLGVHASANPTGDPGARPFAVRVTTGALNVRSGPSASNSDIGTAAQGQVFAAVGASNGWFKINFAGRAGWCNGDFLANDASPIGRVTAATLNVRSGAGTNFGVLGSLAQGQLVAVRATQSGWLRIDFGDRAGFVSASYVTVGGGTTNPVPPAPPAPPAPPTPRPGTRPVSAAGFIQMAPTGPGFFCYYTELRRWGTPRLIYGLERAARRWVSERPAGATPRLGIGDISAKNGGPISGHASHQKGVDVDMSLPRDDGKESPRVDRFSGAYSRAGTQKMINLLRAELPVTMIFFNDPKVTGRQNWPNHDDHTHTRIR